MAAAVAACAARREVTVDSAECAAKSYPGFWRDLERLKEETE
jgi:5-enolpyruvylshikimate-3-phosphate synthase